MTKIQHRATQKCVLDYLLFLTVILSFSSALTNHDVYFKYLAASK